MYRKANGRICEARICKLISDGDHLHIFPSAYLHIFSSAHLFLPHAPLKRNAQEFGSLNGKLHREFVDDFLGITANDE